MPKARGRILVVAALLLAGCSSYDERQWLKLDQKYTTEEFRRDHAACSKGGRLDDACMRGRGWVAVNPAGKSETPKDPYAREIGAPANRRSGY
jgi:hypothetical protein